MQGSRKSENDGSRNQKETTINSKPIGLLNERTDVDGLLEWCALIWGMEKLKMMMTA